MTEQNNTRDAAPGQALGTARVAALADGVFAIVLTLLVLDRPARSTCGDPGAIALPTTRSRAPVRLFRYQLRRPRRLLVRPPHGAALHRPLRPRAPWDHSRLSLDHRFRAVWLRRSGETTNFRWPRRSTASICFSREWFATRIGFTRPPPIVWSIPDRSRDASLREAHLPARSLALHSCRCARMAEHDCGLRLLRPDPAALRQTGPPDATPDLPSRQILSAIAPAAGSIRAITVE